jgi:hypothetical protein
LHVCMQSYIRLFLKVFVFRFLLKHSKIYHRPKTNESLENRWTLGN